MNLQVIIAYVSREEKSGGHDECPHAKKLLFFRDECWYEVIALINKKMRARVFRDGQEVGTWEIRADQTPMLICSRGGSAVYVFSPRGSAYPHPHVGGSSGALCWGSAPKRAELPFILAALLNINLGSAYWQPTYNRNRSQS